MLLRIIALTLGGLIVKELLSNAKEDSGMANTHIQFLKLEQAISLSSIRRKRLIASRKALQKKIVDFFRSNTKSPVPKFFIQGSYKMGTMVIDKDGTYDVDLGVYFLTKPDITPNTLKSYIYKAVESHTGSSPQDRDKCVRVLYAGDFDIDLPVYYKSASDRNPYLATKQGWVLSDPKELCDWFEKKKDPNGQLVRLVKYFKYWAKIQDRKMPSGIAFTVWVTSYYKPNLRDDIAFYETAKSVQNSFFWDTTCRNPATPGDNFLAKLNEMQKSNFKDAFSNLIKDAEFALKQDNAMLACNTWRKQFKDKFHLA